MFPPDLALPMVAPVDLGRLAARLLQADDVPAEPVYVEGPARYSSPYVANAFADALGRSVKLAVTPRKNWEAAYRKLGFSKSAAKAFARMTAVSIDGGFDMPDDPVRGTVTLLGYIADRVARIGKTV